MAEIVLQSLTKTFANGVTALRDLSLAVADGELVVLVGPSGCGKTTTLRLIAGLEKPTQGDLFLDGKRINAWPVARRRLGYVFQRPALYPYLDVADNLAFGLRLEWNGLLPHCLSSPRRRAEIAARVSKVATLLGLDNLLDRRPAELSGGQQQRVALGRAVVRQPAAYLLDEPFSGLDLPQRSELRRQLHLLRLDRPATMIYVTHDQFEAMALADRVVVLDRGVARQVGRPQEVYDQPADRFVAGFLGWPPMAFLSGKVTRDESGRWWLDGGDVRLQLAGIPDPWAGRPVVLGLRPEDLGLAEPSEGPEAPFALRMDVLGKERIGALALVRVKRGGWELTVRLDDRGPSWDRPTVEVLLDAERLHWFDPADGRRLNVTGPRAR